MGKYAEQLANSRKNMTPDAIRAAKCQRSKERNRTHKQEVQQKIKERQDAYLALSLKDRVKKLDRLLGKDKGAKKERAKLKTLIETAKEKS